MRNRGQAALEFLMTYGWAILVILIAVVALSYFGVLSFDMFLPNKCALPSGITCLDFNVETSRVVLVLQNNFGETITINEVTVANKNGSVCSSIDSILLDNSRKAIITIINCNNGNHGQKFIGDLNVSYTKESLLVHLATGSIAAKVSGETSISSSNICQTAENDGLCGGLDIVFGVGYRAACCSEYFLCC